MNERQQVTQDTRPSGASIRQRVFGEANGQRTARGDPFLAPFFETAVEHVWGGVWNRPGLDLKYRSLVVVSVLAATGHNEELKTHLRGALNLGWTVDELREASHRAESAVHLHPRQGSDRLAARRPGRRVTETPAPPELHQGGPSIEPRLRLFSCSRLLAGAALPGSCQFRCRRKKGFAGVAFRPFSVPGISRRRLRCHTALSETGHLVSWF